MIDYRHQEVDWNGQYECPVCHGDNIETDDSGEYDDFYCYAMYCEDCGAVFKQWYKMTPHSVDYSTKEEYEESNRITQQALQEIHQHALNVVASVPPSELPHVELRHNYDLAPASDNPILDVLSQAQADTATRNLRMPKANWQAINEALSDS